MEIEGHGVLKEHTLGTRNRRAHHNYIESVDLVYTNKFVICAFLLLILIVYMQQHHRFKHMFRGILMFAVIALSISAVNVERAHATIMLNCPFTPEAGRTIVKFTDKERIVSDTVNYPEFSYKTKAYSTLLPAGTYKVTLYSTDGGIDRKNLPAEPNERWFGILYNGTTEVARTSPTDDLADGTTTPSVDLGDGIDRVDAEFVVDSDLVLGSAVDSVLAYHANYPDTTSANSVVPICAAFDDVTPPVVIPSPSPTPDATSTPSTPTGHATLEVIKTVINDDSGSKAATDFPLFVGSTQVITNVPTTFTPGTYTVSETSDSDYEASEWGGDCAADGTITLNDGDNKTCTITNNDVAHHSSSSSSRRRGSGSVLGASTAPLTCVPAEQTALLGQVVTFNAEGGSGDYEWLPLEDSVHATGNVFTRVYNMPGIKQVLLKSNDEIATCSVTIPDAISIASPGLPNTGGGGALLISIHLALLIAALTLAYLAVRKNKVGKITQ